MPRDPRYDILFEPVKIGPVTARNRFYQVPHCNGMGYDMPLALAAMRGMKAEGGWAVVCTEECEIHPSGDVSPYKEARLWDDHDIPALAHMTEAVHRHGSLAGCELVHNGPSCANIYSRMAPIGPSHQPVNSYFTAQARAMDKEDIRNYRRWHREAATRAKPSPRADCMCPVSSASASKPIASIHSNGPRDMPKRRNARSIRSIGSPSATSRTASDRYGRINR